MVFGGWGGGCAATDEGKVEVCAAAGGGTVVKIASTLCSATGEDAASMGRFSMVVMQEDMLGICYAMSPSCFCMLAIILVMASIHGLCLRCRRRPIPIIGAWHL